MFHLPFPARAFDHVFACFVLEHLQAPGRAPWSPYAAPPPR
ncbi:methyltransferase domain-containing protein [Streptomyces decoyicus]